MLYKIELIYDAESDLADIYDYIALHDSQNNADYVLEQLLATANSLSTLPERGCFPQELQKLGIREYRQIFFSSYRIIYRIINNRVIIFVIADGRRDMQTLLMKRLLTTS